MKRIYRSNMELSMVETLLLALLISCFLVYITWNTMNRKCFLPPGPTPLPLIGNLLQIKSGKVAEYLMQLGNQYGSIYTVYFGRRPIVILNGYQAVKEALIDNGEAFSGRGRWSFVDIFFNGYGVTFSNGERWKQLRRFSLMTLRQFGMGKRSIEERIQEEARFLVEEIRTFKQTPTDPQNILSQAVANVICSVVFGSRSEYDDMKFLKLLNQFTKSLQLTNSTWAQLQEMFPSVMNSIPGPHQKLKAMFKPILEFISERVKKNEATLDPSAPRDYIDCFLIKMKQEKQNPTSEFNMKNLVLTVVNLFFAGTETVSTTLRHGLLILLKYPEIQKKLQEEIDRVIDQNRSPSIEDRSKMPYMDAVIHEIQRFSDVAPLNLPHTVIKDTKFRQYIIPKGTDVYPLLCSVLRDPRQFSTPNKFNPKHFLDDSGYFKKSDAFLPFSTGKRICIGEGLARMELFLFITNILQNFTLTSNTHFTESDITPKLSGFANIPISYNLSFTPR
ncbi:cytochrome P450 2G1-like [Discoglossus pictus]